MPSRRPDKRPISLSIPTMELLELTIARRTLPISRGFLLGNRYAYVRAYNAKILCGYTDISSAGESLAGDVTYVAGLYIAGVLGGASL